MARARCIWFRLTNLARLGPALPIPTLADLRDGDWVRADAARARSLRPRIMRSCSRPIKQVPRPRPLADKANYRHFMAKEIHEAPEVVRSYPLQRYVEYGRPNASPLPAKTAFDLGMFQPDLDSRPAAPASLRGFMSRNTGSERPRAPCPGAKIDLRLRIPATAKPPFCTRAISRSFHLQSGETDRYGWPHLRYAKGKGVQHALVVGGGGNKEVARTSTIARRKDPADRAGRTLAGPENRVALDQRPLHPAVAWCWPRSRSARRQGARPSCRCR